MLFKLLNVISKTSSHQSALRKVCGESKVIHGFSMMYVWGAPNPTLLRVNCIFLSKQYVQQHVGLLTHTQLTSYHPQLFPKGVILVQFWVALLRFFISLVNCFCLSSSINDLWDIVLDDYIHFDPQHQCCKKYL